MSSAREGLIAEIEGAIGRQKLVWFGTRCLDALPLLAIKQFSGAYGLIAPLDVPSCSDHGPVCLEQLTGERVDLNAYSIDDDNSEHAQELHRLLIDRLEPGTVVATYRPTAFLSAAYYPRMENVKYLGLLHVHQAAFEHKPWAETQLKHHKVPVIPWRYFGDSDVRVLAEWIEGRAFVLRANYSDGGIGLRLVRENESPLDCIPSHTGGFIGAAPLLEPNIPMNVSGCVFPKGRVTARAPSVQLIGLPSCTNRAFGYCGNDFAAALPAVGHEGMLQLDRLVRDVGAWLSTQGYRGAFGLDALYFEGKMHLAEINPRFQGSSALGAKIASSAGLSDIYLDHLAAFLDLDPPEDDTGLVDLATIQSSTAHAASQVVCYNTGPRKERRPKAVVPDLDFGDIKGAPEPGVDVVNESMLFKLFLAGSVTPDGFSIPDWLVAEIKRLTDALFVDL